MPSSTSSLQLTFPKRDTEFGVTRETLKALASRLDLSEAEVVHVALARLALDQLTGYEADQGALTAQDVIAVRSAARADLPIGKIHGKQTLL